MITITRSLARQLRDMLRRANLAARSARSPAPVLFVASADELQIRAVNHVVAVEYSLPGGFEPEQIALSIEALAACEGKRDDPVTLENVRGGKVCVRWEDHGLPQAQEHEDALGTIGESWPVLPEQLAANGRRFLESLRTAMETIDQKGTYRYALNTVQLQGKTGKMIATDTRQAIVLSGGFKFPWQEDVLISYADVFNFADFPRDAQVEVGATDTHVCIRIGPWTIFLARVTEGRFPDVAGACPNRALVKSRIHIAPEDGLFLKQALPRLPAGEESDSPITVDCKGQIAIRAKGPDDVLTTELVLSRSQITGAPVRLMMNRRYLDRALDLGFGDIQIVDPDSPIICEDGERTYFWMGLGGEGALPRVRDCIRIDSATGTQTKQTASASNNHSSNPNHERSPAMARSNGNNPSETPATNSSNGATPAKGQSSDSQPQNGPATDAHENGSSQAEPAATDPIVAAEALQATLRTALDNTTSLIRILRRNRKQARLVESTLASLRQLKAVS